MGPGVRAEKFKPGEMKWLCQSSGRTKRSGSLQNPRVARRLPLGQTSQPHQPCETGGEMSRQRNCLFDGSNNTGTRQ